MARFACLVAVCLIALATLAPTAIGIAGVCDEDACTVSVPEPSSLVLVATGLGALGWVVRRRR
jgi:hypothetical protein